MAHIYRDRRYSLLLRPLSVRRRGRYIGWALLAMGAVLLGMVLMFGRSPSVNAPSGVEPAVSSVKPSDAAIAKYAVQSNLPRYITIPSINVPETRVMPLGLTKHNQIAVPANIYDAGWYNGSARPGQDGAMFIYGHVSSWRAKGIFYNLSKLKPGDTIDVQRGDGSVYSYQVVTLKTYPHDNVDMHAVLSPVDPKVPGLNLMTCTGHIIKGTSEFDQRLVVFARQV